MLRVIIAGHPDQTINYQNFLLMLGIQPMLRERYRSMDTPGSYDALLLPGGGDIEPSLFHAPNTASRNIDTKIDLVQYRYLNDCVIAKKPVVGICKGMQLINVYFGGTLLQDMPASSLSMHAQDTMGKDRYHKIYPVANDRYDEKSSLFPFMGRIAPHFPPFVVNSAHHQCLDRLGENLLISHVAEDGVIEGIYHGTLPIIGLQWHPERLLSCP